ncbi:MAG: hypothetical protein AB8G11_07240 [Saprospiraceae bacterium]
MKELILAVCMMAISISAYSQVNVDGIDINEKADLEYVQIVGSAKLNGQVIIVIDYGQKRKFFKPSVIKNSEGKTQTFNSMIAALNFMSSNGWEYVNSYAVTVGNSNVYHYLLKRSE